MTTIIDDPKIQRMRPSFTAVMGNRPRPVDIDGRPGLAHREQFWAMEVPESLALPGPSLGNLREVVARMWGWGEKGGDPGWNQDWSRDRVVSSICRDDLVRGHKIALLHSSDRDYSDYSDSHPDRIPLAAVDARAYAFFRRRFQTAVVRAGGRKPVLFLGPVGLVAAIMPIHLDRWALKLGKGQENHN